MKNEAISLAFVLVPLLLPVMNPGAQAAVDIFSGMGSSTEETTVEPQLEESNHGLQTCISDVYSEEPIQFDGQILSLNKISSTVKAIPKPPPMPELPQTWSRFTNIFQLPRFSEMGQEFKAIIDQYRAVIHVYVQQWMGFFKQRHQASMAEIQGTVRDMNRKIHDSFANHFEEFRDVCLPDSDACLRSIQEGIDGYDKRLNDNVGACREFAKRQVEQHQRWIESEQKRLERPFLRVEDCFGHGRVGISLASCVGNMVGNVVKATTDGIKRFSDAMANASNSLTDHLGRFRKCVVNRKKLLDRGQERIAERAKKCLQHHKQSADKEGEFFGGGAGGGGDSGDEDLEVDDVFR